MKLPLVSGTSSRTGNPWVKQEYVLETMDTFPRKIHFDFFGDRVNQYPLEVGDYVVLDFDIESREYQGRWYTSIRGWKAVKYDPNTAPAAPANDSFATQQANDPFAAQPDAASHPSQAPQGQPAAPAPDFTAAGDQGEDLPF